MAWYIQELLRSAFNYRRLIEVRSVWISQGDTETVAAQNTKPCISPNSLYETRILTPSAEGAIDRSFTEDSRSG